MKKVLILCGMFLISTAFAQDDKQKNPGVELPDFVITGKENISIQSSNKIKPDFVPIISEEFIKPVFSPEQLETKDIGNPVKEDLNLFDSLNFYKGRLKVGAGLYTLPEAQVTFSEPFKSGLFNVGLIGFNRRAYVDNSDRYGLTGTAALKYFVGDDSKFLPGSEIKIDGSYGINSYKLFASNFPNIRRSFGLGNAALQFNYLTNKVIVAAVKLEDEFASLNDVTFSENVFKISGMSRLQLSNFAIGVNAKFVSASLENSLFSAASFGYTDLRPFLGLIISDGLKATIGMDFAFYDGKTSFNPYVSLGLKLDKNISMFAEFAPRTEFISAGTFLKRNQYLKADSVTGVFYNLGSNIRAVVKYEYGKYFEVDGGFEYISSQNYPYFAPALTKGEFIIASVAAKRFEGFLNLIFHTGPYGILYGSFSFRDTRDTSNSIVPYNSAIVADLHYSYNINAKFNAGFSVDFRSGSFTDLTNTKKAEGLFDLGLNLGYQVNTKFMWTFEVNNLINRSNYLWDGYKEQPLDVVAGFKYQW